MRWAGHVACMGKWVQNFNQKISGPMCKWENNIKMNLKEIRCEDVDWIHLPQGRDQMWASVNTV